MQLQSCILVVMLAAIGTAIADTTCQLSIKKAKLRPSDSHLRIRGHIDVGNNDCKPTTNDTENVTTTVIFKSKKNFSFQDANKVTHSGNECNIIAKWYNKPDEYSDNKKKTEVYVPLRFIEEIKCNKDASAIPSTSTKKSKHSTRRRKTTTKRKTTKKTSKKTTKRKTTKKTTKKTKKKTKKTTKKTTKKSSGGSGSSFSGEHYSGKATFFTPNQGACGDWNDDNDYIAAIGGSLYGSYSHESKYCNKKVKVVNKANGKSVTVTIKDACESCDKTHIDLSPAAFAQIGKFDTGILKVDWYIQ